MSANPEMEVSPDAPEKREVKPEILFFCKTCQRVVMDPPRRGKKYEYSCPACKEDRVVFGTRSAITDYFHIKESLLQKMFDEPNVLPAHVTESRERRAARQKERESRPPRGASKGIRGGKSSGKGGARGPRK